MDDLLNLSEAAIYLRCSKQTLYTDTCKSGAHRYPFYKDGGRILYSRAELEAHLRARRVASSAELQQEAVNGK